MHVCKQDNEVISNNQVTGILRRVQYSWFQTFAMFWMLCSFFWVISWHLNFICWHFRILYLFHLHKQVGTKYDWIPIIRHTYLPMKMEQSVPKRRRIKFRHWGITQKEEHNRVQYVHHTVLLHYVGNKLNAVSGFESWDNFMDRSLFT